MRGAKFRTSKGLRPQGGGTQPQLTEFYPVLKCWFEQQRARGEHVRAQDLFEAWLELCTFTKRHLEIQKEEVGLSPLESKKLAAVSSKLEQAGFSKFKEYWIDRIKFEIGAVLLASAVRNI